MCFNLKIFKNNLKIFKNSLPNNPTNKILLKTFASYVNKIN